MATEKKELIFKKNGQKRPYFVAGQNVNLGDKENPVFLPDRLAEMEQSIVDAAGKADTAVQDANYVHTDNNYTSEDKSKLSNLHNYDDTELDGRVSQLDEAIDRIQAAIDALTGTGDTTAAINTMNEVATFLAGVTNNETLVGKLNELRTLINGKLDMVPGKGLSTEDYTSAEKSKLGALPTKSELDAALADAGKVKTVSINGGSPMTPDSTGNVDLGTIKGEKGDKGDKGDTVLISETSQEFAGMIVNDLTTGGGDNALSAEMGKSLKELIDNIGDVSIVDVIDALLSNSAVAALSARQGKLIYDNIMRIMSSLRPSAFWDNQAPALDWVGDVTKYNVTYQLSNCSAGSSATQVAEGGTLIVELTPSNGYTLQGVIPSVTDGSGAVEHTKSYNASTGKLTVTVRNVTSTITISASAIVLRTVTFNSQSLTWDGPASVPNGGQVTGKVTATGNYALPTAAPTISGAHGTVTWDNTTGDLTIANITANITITAEGVAGHGVTASIIDPTRNVATDKVTLDNTNGVAHGGTYNGQLTIAEGWNVDEVTVEMGGVEVQGAYDSTDHTITVGNVTDDIAINVKATSIMRITRGKSLNIYCQPANENFASFDANKCYTDYLKFNIKTGDTITWHTGYDNPGSTMAGKGNLGLYDKNKDVLYKLNDVESLGYSTSTMSNGQRVFTVPNTMVAALNAANGTSGEEAEMYFRASMLMTDGDIDSGCYFSQVRDGVEIARYNAELGLSEAGDVLHTVTINHIKSDNTQVEITNSGAAYSGTEINVAHSNAALIHDFFHGKTLKVKLTAKTGFTRTSVVVMRGDDDVTSTAFNSSTGVVSVEVTDDVVITVKTTANS